LAYRSVSVTHRHIKNNRLANAGWMWAFSASSNCEPAGQHYRRRREHAVQRHIEQLQALGYRVTIEEAA